MEVSLKPTNFLTVIIIVIVTVIVRVRVLVIIVIIVPVIIVILRIRGGCYFARTVLEIVQRPLHLPHIGSQRCTPRLFLGRLGGRIRGQS